MRPVLETPRLILRPFAEEDADVVFAVYSDRETNTFLPWFPAETKEETARLCARHARREQSRERQGHAAARHDVPLFL